MFTHITDPTTKNKININTSNGKEILNNYIEFVNNKKGGASTGATINSSFIIVKPDASRQRPILNYFDSWWNNSEKIIDEFRLLLEQINLARLHMNTTALNTSTQFLDKIKVFKAAIYKQLTSISKNSTNLIQLADAIKRNIRELNMLLPEKNLEEQQFIKKLLEILDELVNAQKSLDKAKKYQTFEARARARSHIPKDTEGAKKEEDILEASTKIQVALDDFRQLREESIREFYTFLDKSYTRVKSGKTKMERKLEFVGRNGSVGDNAWRGVKITNLAPRSLSREINSVYIIEANEAKGGRPRRVSVSIECVNDFMLKATIKYIQSTGNLWQNIPLNTRRTRKAHYVEVLITVPRSIVLTNITHRPYSNAGYGDNYMKYFENAVSEKSPDSNILPIIELLLNSPNKIKNNKRLIKFILDKVFTGERRHYFSHTIVPFFDLQNRKIVTYGDMNIHQSYIVLIKNFDTESNGYGIEIVANSLIPKFKGRITYDYYKRLQYTDFSTIMNLTLGSKLISPPREMSIPDYVFTSSPSIFNSCNIM